ncbi:hypothetical protein E7811_16435 [Aliigemmobacter aestuarii]|uniref:C-type lysozyme inhibitor domain-containing protein n=1 Tax=Aliigemmobacter aestuarii TaxID=1445661 RepID=A0A4S3MJ96_9RHOB|nr:MliC family protein [Gemmobacter aestuarii]THD81499.1 hypothetical protein E7811_16435 [Gemmobacter aestuarii]
MPAPRLPALCLMVLAPAYAVAAADLASQRYLCDRDAQVWASYVNTDAGSFAVVAFEGRQVAFEVAPSASGARYQSADGAWTWWTKGDEAMLTHGAGNDEVTVYRSCRAAPAP